MRDLQYPNQALSGALGGGSGGWGPYGGVRRDQAAVGRKRKNSVGRMKILKAVSAFFAAELGWPQLTIGGSSASSRTCSASSRSAASSTAALSRSRRARIRRGSAAVGARSATPGLVEDPRRGRSGDRQVREIVQLRPASLRDQVRVHRIPNRLLRPNPAPNRRMEPPSKLGAIESAHVPGCDRVWSPMART